MQGVWTSCALQGTDEEVNVKLYLLTCFFFFFLFFFLFCSERERERWERFGFFVFFLWGVAAKFLIDENFFLIFFRMVQFEAR